MRCGKASLSIVIPMYNAASDIASTLDSIAAQEGVDAEIIVVDDCSTDNSLEVVQDWTSQNKHIPVQTVTQEQRRRTLKARIAGIERASGNDLLFVDADDRLTGIGNIAKILEIKRAGGYEIAHFRSQFQGEICGEASWNAPLPGKPLRGRDVFSTYVACRFPPVLVWGKIYSTSLLKRIVPLAKGMEIWRLEDVFFVSLLMLFAKSYCQVNEFAYLYRVSNNWSVEKYAGRVHDLFKMRPFFNDLMKNNEVSPKDSAHFMAFLNRRIAFNLNGLCRETVDALDGDLNRDELLAKLAPYLDCTELLAATASVFAGNIAKNRVLEQTVGG